MTSGAPSLPRVLAGWRPNRAIGFEEHLAAVGPAPLPESSGRYELIAEIERSGLLGRGGAGFPAATKMHAVAGARRGRRIVVANGAEGEPASHKDEVLLAGTPHLVLDGAVLSAAAVGADEVIVCVKETAISAVTAVQRAVGERASSDPVKLTVVEVPATYIAGEESALVNYLNTGRAIPTFVPPRPFERGVDGRPTLIQNVETLAHAALIARHGADWFRGLGTPQDPGSSLVTLCGAVTTPGVYEVPSGTPLSALVEHAGGPAAPIQAFLVGGYAGTWFSHQRGSDLRLGHAALQAQDGGLGAGVVAALPARACGVCETTRVARFLAEESAGQCGPCVHGLASIADALEEISEGAAEPGTYRWIEKWTEDVTGRGACRHPDGVVRFVASAVFTFMDAIRRHESGEACDASGRSWILPIPGPAEPA